MKKIKFSFVVLICLSFGLMLAACTNDDFKAKIDTPVVTIDDDGLASWSAVVNAKGYEYIVSDEAAKVTTRTSVQLTNGQTIKVKALADASYSDSDYSEVLTYTKVIVDENTYGLPVPETGYYMKNADLIEEENVRYLTYVTNKSSGEEDSVIAIKKGTLTDKGWLYGEEKIAVEPSVDGWDQYLTSASIVKGVFKYNDVSYSYLMAYSASSQKDENAGQIGLAVATEPTADWVKVGTAPVIEYNKEVYGNFAGCVSPSLVNYDKQSGIRIFYTYADAYGLFARFFDANLADLSKIDGVTAQITNKGALQGGEDVLMFPNADFAYDEVNKKFVCVKDISPAGSTNPKVALSVEVCEIAEEELYTTDILNGFSSLGFFDGLDVAQDGVSYERVYNASLVSDAYGHMLSKIEIVYTVSELQSDNADYLYTQHILSYVLD